jgi:hypothetical protein
LRIIVPALVPSVQGPVSEPEPDWPTEPVQAPELVLAPVPVKPAC